jgi:hypothetical protein
VANANEADFLGEGTNAGVKKPNDPNDLPNPKNPGGISNNELAKRRALNQAANGGYIYSPGAGAGTNPAGEQAALEYKRSQLKRQGSGGSVWNDIKKIWTSDPVTTAVLAAPYGVVAGGLVAGGGTLAGAGTSGAAVGGGTLAPVTAAPTLGSVGTVASPFPASAAAAGPAMYSAPAVATAAAASGMSVKDWLKAAVLAGVVTKTVADQVMRDSGSGGGGGGGGAAAPAGVATNYGPSGGYLKPTVTQPGASVQQAAQSFAGAENMNLGYPTTAASQGIAALSNRRPDLNVSQNTTAYPNLQLRQDPQSGAQQVQNLASTFAGQNAAASQGYAQQGAAAQGRAAPQISAPSNANMQSVYNAAGSFQPNTSGVAGIRAATADVSGAQNLEGFQSTNSQQGVNALYGFRPDETFRSANQLENFQATNTAAGANAVNAFRPDMVQQDAEDLRNFRADRSGINRLNAYADEAQGPSAAQAMLRSQSDADKRTMLAISRSGRGGPGAAVNAQRQAITEGGLIAAETRGQGAALAAQEFEAYKGRQLQALAQAGSLISQAEAQRLQGLAQAGALMSQADQQKLQAVMAYGQLKATQDSQQLSAKQSAGQLNANAENMLLGATSNAAQLQGQMDQQRLGALTSAGQIRLQGSAINQQGQIAATQAELQGSAQQLQAMGLQGQIASDMRNQDIQVLRANLDASMQQLNLNDTQVRYFAGLGAQVDMASQNIQMQASQFGVNADQAQQQLNLQYQQAMYNQLSQQQQLEYNYAALNSNNALGMGSQAIQIAGQQQNQNQFNQQQSNADRDFWLRAGGSAVSALSLL